MVCAEVVFERDFEVGFLKVSVTIREVFSKVLEHNGEGEIPTLSSLLGLLCLQGRSSAAFAAMMSRMPLLISLE